MKKVKSANHKIFDQILSINKQKENEFNNAQDGAIILSILVMFFVPFLLLNAARNFLGIDYSFVSVVAMLAVSAIITYTLYKTLKIGSEFAEKHIVLDQLLMRYTPKNKTEFKNLQKERKANPSSNYSLVKTWADKERLYYVN
ncbi:hypothetical protein [Providencia sp. Me31A]|uniref:hypothetical protein n=1 Tax=Providencia sp. Me31A TaxID=3392637 RepID=UPI003D279596